MKECTEHNYKKVEISYPENMTKCLVKYECKCGNTKIVSEIRTNQRLDHADKNNK